MKVTKKKKNEKEEEGDASEQVTKREQIVFVEIQSLSHWRLWMPQMPLRPLSELQTTLVCSIGCFFFC